MFKWLRTKIVDLILAYLERKSDKYEPFSVTDPATLKACLRPGDVLLVEGNKRISAIIKYLTQSTWSHAALYVGDSACQVDADGEPLCLIEALSEGGVVAVPLKKYAGFNTRICRPVGIEQADAQQVVTFMVDSLGMQYDTQNVIDLMRYLIPKPPVPIRWRRRMLAFGSGDPTRAICSTLIAQAFQSIKYPILPITRTDPSDGYLDYTEREILHIRHHSLFTPRDFDVSPYFAVVKPTIEMGFDYKRLNWGTEAAQPIDLDAMDPAKKEKAH